MSSFTKPLRVEPLPDGKNFKLIQSFSYHVGSKSSRQVIKVPKDFITDFASVPQFLIAILGIVSIFVGHVYKLPWFVVIGVLAVLGASLLPNWGKYGKAAVIHDRIYETHEVSRKMADLIFLEAMEVLGVNIVERYVMYYAVRIFGSFVWR